MSLFRRLALASTVSTLLLVTIGGLVRATKSGLGCGTDWPHCSGRLIPALENRAVIIEYSHRLAASVVMILLGALTVVAWRRLRAEPRLIKASAGAFGLVLWQAVLGAIVVKLELEAVSVVLHLTTAMALLGLLVYILVASHPSATREPPYVADRTVSGRASLAASAVLVVLMAGSYVSGTPGAGSAFADWPLMGGRLVPDLSVHAIAVHFAHRALVVVAGVTVFATGLSIVRRKAELVLQARLAHIAMGVFALEILVGAANVWTDLNAAVVTAHLLLGAVVWSSLVGIAVVSRPQVTRARERVTRSHPALDASHL